MDKEEAINCIQDLMDVANCHGSSCVYKHNGGVARLKNVLECLKNCDPVVRCKDCRFFIDDGITKQKHVCGFRSFSGYDCEARPDDFCSCGERRENTNATD